MEVSLDILTQSSFVVFTGHVHELIVLYDSRGIVKNSVEVRSEVPENKVGIVEEL